MTRKLIECHAIPQGHEARIVETEDKTVVEIWDLNNDEFPAIQHDLTPDDVFCVEASIKDFNLLKNNLGNMYFHDANGNVILKTKSNKSLIEKFYIGDICKDKTEVTINQFINICKK